jgi:hypothetical protein
MLVDWLSIEIASWGSSAALADASIHSRPHGKQEGPSQVTHGLDGGHHTRQTVP